MKFFYLSFLFFFFSCQEKAIENKLKSTTTNTTAKTKNGIQELTRLSFRRTYVGHENLSDKELEKLHTSNPSPLVYEDSKIIRKLNQLKLLENDNLILSKFENIRLKKEYLDNEKKIEITCKYDSLSISKIEISVKYKAQKSTKTLDFKGDHIIGILLKDIDHDHRKEILIVTNYYIMNGDNFDLRILQYKNK